MSFYAQFASHYERVFPFRPATLGFLSEQMPASGRVLDLGCGTGHYTGALAARNLEAVGLDLDAAMIDAARERYGAALFAVGDLLETATIAGSADGAFCIGNVLPHLRPDHLDKFLVDLAGILPPSAPWIVQTVNFDRLLPLVEVHEFPPLDAGEGLVFHRRYTPRPEGEIGFATALSRNGDTVFEGDASLWPLTSEDLAARHADAGFELVGQAGGFKGEAFDAAASGGCVQIYRRTATA